MKTMKFRSMMLTALAMLAVSMMSLSLTACSDDDDNDGVVSPYKQWIFTSKSSDDIKMGPDVEVESVMYDLSTQGKLIMAAKPRANIAEHLGLDASKYYKFQETDATVTLNDDKTSGTISTGGEGDLPFRNLTAKSVTIYNPEDETQYVTFTASSKKIEIYDMPNIIR